MTTNINKYSYLDAYNNIDLKGIKIVMVNNKPTPIISTSVLLKGSSNRLQILLYLAKLISENKTRTIEEIVNYLENSDGKKIETLKIINSECEREPMLKNIISTKEFPYKIKELEEIMERDEFVKKDEDGNIKNILFDFIKKVSELTQFTFSDKMPRSIGLNISTIKKFLNDNDIKLEDLEWFFDNVYKRYIYDGYKHKSIRGFLLDAEEYFANTKQIQSIIKCLVPYMVVKNIKRTSLSTGMEFKKNKELITSILQNINWDIDIFNKILDDFSKKYKSKGLNWNLNTIFKNLYNEYPHYIHNEESNNENKNTETYDDIFTMFISENKITDKELINEYHKVYKKHGIESLKELI